MEFYIYENSQWTQVYVEIEPKLSRAWDTTNDSFSCVLKASTKEMPYKPMTAFKIVDDDNKETIMWIINDTVNVFSLSPLCYKHSLSIVQFRYFLNKHLLRTTVCNQPRINKQKLYTAVSVNLDNPSDNYACFPDDNNTAQDRSVIQRWYDDIQLNYHAKVKNLFFKWDFFGVYVDIDSGQQPLKQIPQSLIPTANASLRMGTYVRIADVNNNNYNIVGPYYIFEYDQNKKIQLPNSAVETINTYIASHPTAKLRAVYGVNARPGDSVPSDSSLIQTEEDAFFYSLSFLNTLDDQETYLTVNNFEPLTLQVEIELEYYYYTMYDVIDTLLKQYRLTTSNYGSKREQLFNLPASGDLYDLLTSTYPPDTLSFTQATFYDALTEIFRFYDAGFKFDENKTLQIEYYNDPQDKITNFEKSGITISHSERNYNNGRVAYYQNSINKIDIKKIGTRSTGLGVPEQSQYAIILPKPIYDIEKLSMYLTGTFTLCNQPSVVLNNVELDLTHFVVSDSVWAVLDKISITYGGTVYNNLYQEGVIKFTRGANDISVSSYYRDVWKKQKNILQNVLRMSWRRFFGINHGYTIGNWGEPSFSDFSGLSNTWNIQVFGITYQTQNNGRLQTETLENQYAGEFIVNQGSGMVDLNKLGLNMLGESIKDGQPVLTATHEITDWSNRVKEGQYIVYNGSMWLANVVNYTPLGSGAYQGTIEFSKNFNALSLRVQNDNQKRLTAISGEQATMSEDNYIDYVYVSVNAYSPSRNRTILGIDTLYSMITQTFGIQNSNSYNIEYAKVNTYREDDTINTSGDSNTAQNIFIPLIKYGAGNCICFEVQFESPINAGNQLKVASGWFGSNQYFSQATPYTDEEGWADKITVGFYKDKNYDISSYPIISAGSLVGSIDKLEYHKKPNEIFGLNYEWCFLPLPNQINDVFIGSEFINKNAFVNQDMMQKSFYLYYETDANHKYTILDRKGHGTRVSVTFGAVDYGVGNYCMSLYMLTSTTITAKSWALCDDVGNIYFASNIQKTFTNSKASSAAIYFLTRRTRIADDETYEPLPAPSGTQTYSFIIDPSEWTLRPNIHTLSVSCQVTIVSIEGNGSGSGTYQSSILIGRAITDLSISQAPGGTNTVSYDQATGTFSFVLHGHNVNVGDTLTATISYKIVGELTFYYYDYAETDANLVGESLTVGTITPASQISIPNSVYFDSATGTFSGRVFRSSLPTDPITYTITYTIN